MRTRQISQLVLLIATLTLSACTSIGTKPIKPTIELLSVRPLNVSVTEQKLRFELKVVNPNNFPMPIEAVDFAARFNDTTIATGKSNQALTIDANSEAVMPLDVTAGLDRLASTLSTLLQGKSLNLDYELSGTVKVATWPKSIPFNVVGAMDLPDS